MKSLEELKAIREKAEKKINQTTSHKNKKIIVGMATCGIAAGARPVFNAVVNEIQKLKLEEVDVLQTGCIGLCRYEPIIEIYINDQKTIYVEMTPERVREVIQKHLIEGKVIEKYEFRDGE